MTAIEAGGYARGAWWRSRWVQALAAIALLVALDRLADFGASRWALSQARHTAEAAAGLRVALLRSEIDKQRTLPVVLAQDPDVRTALETMDAARLDRLNAKFAALAEGTRAGVIYLLDSRGVTVAASNYATPISFVGSDYSFRPYFHEAMSDGAAEYFALGTVSREPGLYLSRRLDNSAGPLGVIVVKAEFETIEAAWRRLPEPTFVTDPRHIVLVTSEPDWRFRTVQPIPPHSREAIRASVQFGDAALDPVPLQADSDGLVRTTAPDATERTYVEARARVPTIDWMLHVLMPTREATGLARTAARSLTLLAGVSMLGAVGLALARRRRLGQERVRQAAARRDLEERVAARTAELSQANERLRAEMDERRRAQAAVDDLQDELVQAGKLAVLGQIAASVAHEVNQPVAAIRTFAENAETLLDRGETGAARVNLTTIAGLTDRIGAITGELRAFARKAPAQPGAVAVSVAIEGALLLLGHRLRQQAITLSVAVPDDAIVVADRVRLEQVFVNLVQNAIEALSDRSDGYIRIAARTDEERISVTVADNGPGLPPEVMGALFLPFTTTKPSGLGLGLVISHDIIAESGGSLTAGNRDGAVFIITLPRAK